MFNQINPITSSDIKKFNKPALYACHVESCEKTFRDARSLKEHIHVHNGEKPLTCSFPSCSKKFSRIASLKKHEIIHKGEKRYVCSECGQAFSQVNDNTYIITHPKY